MVFLPAGDPLLQLAVIFVIGGTIMGAAGVYAPSPASFYGFCTLPFGATLVQLALQSGRTYTLLAAMVAVLGAVMVRVYRDLQGGVVGTLRARIENEDLLERLARSEAQLRDAIESFPEGIAVYDGMDRLVVCNETYARVYGAGRGAAQLPGTSYREIAANAFDAEVVPPELEGRRDAWLEGRMERRRSGAGTLRHYETRDGRSLQGRFVRSRGGGVVSVYTDVTDLRRTKDAYGRLAAEEQLMLDVLPVGVAFFTGRTIVRCNRRLEQMLGYGPGEQRFYLYGSTASFADLVGYYRSVLRTRGDVVFEEPATHMFEVGRFREETMAFPPGVTIRAQTWGGLGGYLSPVPGGQPARFPTVIQIVPVPPGERREP